MARHRVQQRGLVQREIASASFSFYDADEVRKISVKRITNPTLFDGLNNAVPDGLYDPALGPTDAKTTCVTCKYPGGMCDGHFGHIELVVPVYNPLTFGTVVRLLKTTCFHCHRFRMHESRVRRFRERLEMLMDGDVEGAENVMPEISKKAKKEMSEIGKRLRTTATSRRWIWTIFTTSCRGSRRRERTVR